MTRGSLKSLAVVAGVIVVLLFSWTALLPNNECGSNVNWTPMLFGSAGSNASALHEPELKTSGLNQLKDFHSFVGNLDMDPTSFRVLTPPVIDTAQKNICENCENKQCRKRCESYEELVSHLHTGSQTEGARLYIIPLDPIAWLKAQDSDSEAAWNTSEERGELDSSPYMDVLQDAIDQVKSESQYLTFKGSDFVFICLARDCMEVGTDFGKGLSNEMGTRAIFAFNNVDTEGLQWPCPLRTINLYLHNASSIDLVTDTILEEASFLIYRRNRWVCSDEDHPESSWSRITNRTKAIGIYNEEFGFTLCTYAKSGSTMTGMLLRRLMHYDNWNAIGGSINHNHKKSGLRYLEDSKNSTLHKAINADLSIVKGVIVRNPITRLLSGYLDKIYDRREYARVKGIVGNFTRAKPPTFSEFANFLMDHHPNPGVLDGHFRIQSAGCGVRKMEHDFVAKQANLYADMKEFARSLGFWKEYVASGFGGNGTNAFGKRAFQKSRHDSASLVWEHYTEELMLRVYEYYKEDFDRFGFSIDEMLATNPERQLTA